MKKAVLVVAILLLVFPILAQAPVATPRRKISVLAEEECVSPLGSIAVCKRTTTTKPTIVLES